MSFWRHLFGGKDDTPNEPGQQDSHPDQWVEMSKDDPGIHAHLYNQEVVRLYELGHFEWALSKAEEAETIMRVLYRGRNDVPAYATDLTPGI